jgi:peptidyl-prolyl cis-trans isomerase C
MPRAEAAAPSGGPGSGSGGDSAEAAPAALSGGSNPIVAEVDGSPIRLSDVGDAIRNLPAGGGDNSFEILFPPVLQILINRQALVERAQHEGLDEEAATRRALRAATDRVLENAVLRHDAAAHITESALLARYNQTIAGKPGPAEVHGRVIVVPTESQAQDVIAKLAAGADFASLAQQVSTDVTNSSGGDLGWVRYNQVNIAVAAALFSMRAGEVTAYPIPAPAGWFVLKAEARREAPTLTFAQARAGLLDAMVREDSVRVTDEALKGVVVRVYNMNGTEATPHVDSVGTDIGISGATRRGR